jgi:phospholipid N-methyltransferase
MNTQRMFRRVASQTVVVILEVGGGTGALKVAMEANSLVGLE